MSARTISVSAGRPSFIDAPRCDDLNTLDADVAIIGGPSGVPYDMRGSTSPSRSAPQTIREQSQRDVPLLTHDAFDFGGDLFAGRTVKIVDCGDVAMLPGEHAANTQQTTAVARPRRATVGERVFSNSVLSMLCSARRYAHSVGAVVH